MNRRDFMAGLGLGTGAALITGCNSEGPRSLLAAVRSSTCMPHTGSVAIAISRFFYTVGEEHV